jgi:hypothetical protein
LVVEGLTQIHRQTVEIRFLALLLLPAVAEEVLMQIPLMR